VARFSSEQAARPVEQWREVFGEQMLRMDLEPLPGHDFHADWTARVLPGSRIAWARNSPIRVTLRQRLVVDPGDNISLQWATIPRVGKHMGREIAVEPNEAVFLSATDPGSLAFTAPGSLVCMTFPRNALGPLLREKDICLGSKLPAQSGALRLLLRYLEILRDENAATPELQHLTISHIYDLLALALGATRDAAETAKGRGVRAARLHAIKSEILENLQDEKLSAADLATRHQLTPRQVQLLFASEGTTFTDFLREQRLARAHRMLSSPRYDDKSISDIAFACGFGDLSYFNRSFRARYQATPSDVRNVAAQSGSNGQPDG
jgi:AraC-like DNA-binding protein